MEGIDSGGPGRPAEEKGLIATTTRRYGDMGLQIYTLVLNGTGRIHGV